MTLLWNRPLAQLHIESGVREIAFDSGEQQSSWNWRKDPEGERERIDFGNRYLAQMIAINKRLR